MQKTLNGPSVYECRAEVVKYILISPREHTIKSAQWHGNRMITRYFFFLLVVSGRGGTGVRRRTFETGFPLFSGRKIMLKRGRGRKRNRCLARE